MKLVDYLHTDTLKQSWSKNFFKIKRLAQKAGNQFQ